VDAVDAVDAPMVQIAAAVLTEQAKFGSPFNQRWGTQTQSLRTVEHGKMALIWTFHAEIADMGMVIS